MELGVSYEWDDEKRNSNLAKHRIDFTAVYEIDWNIAVTFTETRGGELRNRTIAPLDHRLHVLIWTQREDDIRVISLRKANKREIKLYAQKIAHS